MNVTRDGLHERLRDVEPRGVTNDRTIATILRRLSTNETLERLFDELRTDRTWCEDVAARSYTHDNGFDKIKLLTSTDPQYKLRLHVWWPENLPQEEQQVNFHDHRWDFNSILLAGQMRFMNYDVAEQGRRVYEYEYAPIGDDEQYEMAYVGENTLARRFGGTLRKGVNYTISNDVIHKTYVPKEQLTATLLVQGANEAEVARVFSVEQLGDDSIDAQRMTTNELTEKISKLENTVL